MNDCQTPCRPVYQSRKQAWLISSSIPRAWANIWHMEILNSNVPIALDFPTLSEQIYK